MTGPVDDRRTVDIIYINNNPNFYISVHSDICKAIS